jgi:site-specific DNA-cytosine methylase
MNVLELFSGNHSVGKVCKQLGWDTVSVDMLLPADHQTDIMSFDYKQYPKDHFGVIWASPPCTEYSKAKTRGPRDIEGANKLVLRTLEIIDYFNPEWWFIENPQTGKLKDQEFMKVLGFVDGDYCMYGLPYRKRTRFWTNKIYTTCPLKLCDKKCGSFVDRKHIGSCGNGLSKYTDENYSLHDKYRIPESLILSLFLE